MAKYISEERLKEISAHSSTSRNFYLRSQDIQSHANPQTGAAEMNYIPKGGMCIKCVNWLKNCSHLKFNTMPVIVKDKNIAVVKCLEYKKK